MIPKLKAAIAKSNGGLTKFHLYPEFSANSQRKDEYRFKKLRPRDRIGPKSSHRVNIFGNMPIMYCGHEIGYIEPKVPWMVPQAF